MNRRAFLSAAFLQFPGIREPERETKHARAVRQRVQGTCPIPSCGHVSTTTVEDVHWNEPGRRAVALMCDRCTVLFAVRSPKWREVE